MSGLFRRRSKENRDNSGEGTDEDPFLDMITMKVNDSDGNFFGEVVSADPNAVIIKHEGKFYSFTTANIRNKFGDLMIDTNVNLGDALREGEAWKDPGKAVIGENKFYDFSEQRQREKEREENILHEMAKAHNMSVDPHTDDVDSGSSEVSGDIEDREDVPDQNASVEDTNDPEDESVGIENDDPGDGSDKDDDADAISDEDADPGDGMNGEDHHDDGSDKDADPGAVSEDDDDTDDRSDEEDDPDDTSDEKDITEARDTIST